MDNLTDNINKQELTPIQGGRFDTLVRCDDGTNKVYSQVKPEDVPSAYYAVLQMESFCRQIMNNFSKLKAYGKLFDEPDKITKDDPIWEFIPESYEYYLGNQNSIQLLKDYRSRNHNQTDQAD